jgi:hypothetical protein
MDSIRTHPAVRRYLIRLFSAMTLYIFTLYPAIAYVKTGKVTGIAAYVLAALPGLSTIAVFWAIGRLLVEQKDEYQRMMMVRMSLIASAFSLSIATMWGFFENFGLAAHIDGFYYAVLWYIGLGVGAVYNWFVNSRKADAA